jgi:hypothetical protein
VNELTFKTTRYLSDMLSNFRGNITKWIYNMTQEFWVVWVC